MNIPVESFSSEKKKWTLVDMFFTRVTEGGGMFQGHGDTKKIPPKIELTVFK